MKKKNRSNGSELPLGLGMALAQDRNAMNHFAALGVGGQEEIINGVSGVSSKEEMHSYVNRMFDADPNP